MQPSNRGTANGILLPLLHILDRDPAARVVLLPTDHHVGDEFVLAHSMRQGIEQLTSRSNKIALMGLEPDDADPQLGYIVPGVTDGRADFRTIERFVEKPSAAEARELVETGALWNTFIVIAGAQALLELFQRRVPEVVASMRPAVPGDLASPANGRLLATLYDRLPVIDFSRDILEGQEQHPAGGVISGHRSA